MSTTVGHDVIPIHAPRSLMGGPIPAQRVTVGVPGDYKPCVARLPDGELLLVAFHMHPVDGTRRLGNSQVPLMREDIVLQRSRDGGLSWSEPATLDLPGREPYLTILADGTVLMTVHHLIQDIRNDAGYVQTYVHRSTDRGRSWQTTRFPGADLPRWQTGWTTCSSRNVLEKRDGELVLGVGTQSGINYLYRSRDRGATWTRAQETIYDLYATDELRSKLRFPLWGESVLWEASNGDLLALHRGEAQDLPPRAGQAAPDAHWDHHDRLVIFRSADGGRTWSYAELGGTYGEMYPALLKLRDGRLLLTFTVRDLQPVLGVRALLGEQTVDGFAFDFASDRLMIDTKTAVGADSGGGFGRTDQLDDGTLITSYSYRDADGETHCEVVRWAPPASADR
jgi:hypothetical protein